MADYYTILTRTGSDKVVAALAGNGPALHLTRIAVGDGGGPGFYDQYDRDALRGRNSLVNQHWIDDLNLVDVDPNNPAWVVTEGLIPTHVGGWYIREVGIFDADGDLIAIGVYPETYKPVATAVEADLLVRSIIEVGDADSVELRIDPSQVMATRAWVVDVAIPQALTMLDEAVERAEEARDIARFAVGIFDNEEMGITGTESGDYFWAPRGDNEALVLYRNENNEAIELYRYVSDKAVRAMLSTAERALVESAGRLDRGARYTLSSGTLGHHGQSLHLDFERRSFAIGGWGGADQLHGLDGLVEIQRATSAEYRDQHGEIISAPPHAPRLNYHEDGSFDGLLIDTELPESGDTILPPGYNLSAGTWIVSGRFERARLLPTIGAGFALNGEGTAVYTYDGNSRRLYLAGGVEFEEVHVDDGISYNALEELSDSVPLADLGNSAITSIRYVPRALGEDIASSLADGSLAQYAAYYGDPRWLHSRAARYFELDATTNQYLYTDWSATQHPTAGDKVRIVVNKRWPGASRGLVNLIYGSRFGDYRIESAGGVARVNYEEGGLEVDLSGGTSARVLVSPVNGPLPLQAFPSGTVLTVSFDIKAADGLIGTFPVQKWFGTGSPAHNNRELVPTLVTSEWVRHSFTLEASGNSFPGVYLGDVRGTSGENYLTRAIFRNIQIEFGHTPTDYQNIDILHHVAVADEDDWAPTYEAGDGNPHLYFDGVGNRLRIESPIINSRLAFYFGMVAELLSTSGDNHTRFFACNWNEDYDHRTFQVVASNTTEDTINVTANGRRTSAISNDEALAGVNLITSSSHDMRINNTPQRGPIRISGSRGYRNSAERRTTYIGGQQSGHSGQCGEMRLHYLMALGGGTQYGIATEYISNITGIEIAHELDGVEISQDFDTGDYEP